LNFAAIFDMDGVLVDNIPFHYRAWREVLRMRGIALSRRQYDEILSGKTPEESARTIFGDGISAEESRELNEQKDVLFRSIYREAVVPLRGLVPFLRCLNRMGVPMALATSANPENVELVLTGTDTRRFFAVVVDATMVQRSKPDPQIFEEAAAALGVKPEKCIVFEDSISGLAAAKACGAKVVALATTLRPEQIVDVDRVIRDFTEITVADVIDVFEADGTAH
jgi:beta-phosphoglucomutase family hydrolase